MKAFVPNGDTVNIAVSATSQSVNLGNPDQIRIVNDGTATVWCKLGASGVTATTAAGFPVGPGTNEIISPPVDLAAADVYIAVIAAGASGTIYFTPGVGI